MDEDPTPPLQCNKIDIETFTPLHLDISEDGGLTCLVLWNEFMILLYEADQLNSLPPVYHHNTSIKNVRCKRNILLFSDCDNIIHFTILRKQEGVKNTISNNIVFKRLFEGIYDFCIVDDEIIMLCKKDEGYFVNVFNIIGSSKFKINKKFKLDIGSFNITESQIFIKTLKSFTPDFIKNVLSIDTNDDSDTKILFLSKKDEIYIHQLNDNNQRLSIMHICPAEISHLAFDDEISSKLYLFLVTGSVIILSCDDKSNRINLETIHLNSSIHKVIFNHQNILYTNTEKFWESKLSNDATVKHRLLKIAYVYDFCIASISNKVYCVTLNNSIYSFHLQSEERFSLKELDKECISIPKSLKATGNIFKSILKEMDRNKRVSDTIVRENNLITTMALSKKPELSLNNLKTDVKIYHDMKDIEYSENEIVLVDDLYKYYLGGIVIYLIEFDMSDDFRLKFKDFLKDTIQKWYLNINIDNGFKTNVLSIKFLESACIKIAVPIYEIIIPTNICVKLVSLIPDVMNPNTYCWCFFPSNKIIIDTKYHVRLKEKFSKKNLSNKIVENEDNKIIKIAKKHFGSIYNIINERIDKKTSVNVPYYIRIPESYEKYASEFGSRFAKFLNPKYAQEIVERLNPENIDSTFRLDVINNIVEIKSSTDNKIRKIEINSKDDDIGWQLYAYFFDCFSQFAETDSKRTIAHFDYMRLQRIKNDMNSILSSGTNMDVNTINILLREFYCDIIGILPL